MAAESFFQHKLISELYSKYPGCWIEKADPGYRQGTPDLRFYYGKFWAALEVKRSRHEKHQPNQDEYIARLDAMSFARFIFPENKEEVFKELDAAIQESKEVLH